MIEHPKFAVVGHPNKGKSSIVSALALDDSIQISNTPGTTVKQNSFPLSVDGKILYELFDTPGFQRARRVLAWLKKHDVSAHKRQDVVREFIEEHKNDKRFNDEIELLHPIMNGAGIIYVVDASNPYNQEYEVEMEILRWTGQPSMALINRINDDDYTDEWKRALEQYFNMVRTFNPMQKSILQHMNILESMAQLKEEWIIPVKSSMKLFKYYHEQMLKQSASLISKMIYDSINKIEKITLKDEDVSQKDEEKIKAKYKNTLRDFEHNTQKKIEHIWKHKNLETEKINLTFNTMDLFSKESASVFGLTRKELIVTGVTSGAVTGAGIDLLFAGHTLLLGGIVGAVIGGVGSYLGFNELSEVKVFGQTLGKRSLQMGPMANKNFPYILLGRALYHTQKIANRSHAIRDIEDIDMQNTFKDKWLEDSLSRSLEKYHKKFRSQKEIDPKEIKVYEDLIKGVLENLIH